MFTVRTALSSLLLAALAVALGGCRTAPPRADHAASSDIDLLALQARADDAYGGGRLLEAEQLYRRVLTAAPTSAYAWFRLGNVELRSGRLDSAAEAYRQCLRFEPEGGRCWNNLSLSYLRMASETLDVGLEKVTGEEQRQRLMDLRGRIAGSVAPASDGERQP